MKELRRDTDYVYYRLENASEIDKFHIKVDTTSSPQGGFTFFRGLGVRDYGRTFKMWLREFPKPIFIIAVKNQDLLSWVYIELWGDCSLDGEPVYVLRAIESLPDYRNKKIGQRILLRGVSETVGYVITKPLTREATRFFKRLEFMEPTEFRRSPIDLTQHHGYLILPPYKKKKLLETHHMQL